MPDGSGNMATAELKLSKGDQLEDCIFCCIARGQDEEAEVVKKNEELVCFKDIYPAAPHHYLVVPTLHIESCLSLHWEHIDLVKRMAEMGKAVLREQGITDLTDIRMGFHQPPYTSVDHLHLHVLAPASQISKYMEYKFTPGTYRFVTDEFLRKNLKKNAPIDLCNFKGCMCFLGAVNCKYERKEETTWEDSAN